MMTPLRVQGGWRALPAAALLPVLVIPLLATPAAAHHVMGLFQLQSGPLAGFLSGIGHPLLGPDHLLFLLALGLVAAQRPARWVLSLLAVSLTGTGIGLMAPGLPAAELLVSLSLVVQGLVVIRQLPGWTLLPAFALHGYVLSEAVLGWSAEGVSFYVVGLVVSQTVLLLAAFAVVRPWAGQLGSAGLKLVAGILIGVGGTFAWTALVP